MSTLSRFTILSRLALFSCAILLSGTVSAEPSATSSAAAEALFEDATKLLESGDVSAACEKFRASEDLDPALGTLLRLADCYDRDGKTASAWATFKEVASLAAQREQAERQRMAEERIVDLETRLSRLTLRTTAKARPDGLRITLNGVAVPAASLDSAVPVDPGMQRVQATAPGRKPWNGSIDVPKGPAEVSLAVPALELAPKRKLVDGSAPASESPGSTQRTIGYVTGGVGLASLAVSGVLAYRAHSLREESLEHCRADDANSCTAEGVALRDESLDYAQAANYPFFAGAALLTGGVLLVLTAPSDGAKRARIPRFTASVDPVTRRVNVKVVARW